ncbi:MAG: hypothetical protein WBA74_15485 [Cyclobacteriaceae bacterium]
MKYFQRLFMLIAIAATAMIFPHDIAGQGLRPGGRSLSPSPEASALNKLIDNPISYYTGTPSINVPIYTIQMRELSLPIGLTYNASGLKVSDHASWVGAGWTLNAGGMINRTIKGLPDEFQLGELKGYFFQPSVIDQNGSYIEDYLFDCAVPGNGEGRNLDLVSGGAWDFEPDLYHYAVGGYSGKFLFDKNRDPLQLNASDVEILAHPYENTPYGEYYPTMGEYLWRIKTPDGAVWYFEKSDKHTTFTGCGNGSGTTENGITDRQNAWHLVRVVKGKDEINFEYTGESIEYTDVYSASAQYKALSINELGMNGQSPTPPPLYCTTQNNVYTQRLTKITTNTGYEISFIVDETESGIREDLTGSRNLKEIIVEKNGQPIRHIRLNHEYFGVRKKLKLRSIDQLSVYNSGESIKLYDFAYFENHDFPEINSKKQDMWGYYNGANNLSFLPQWKDENYHVNAKANTDKNPYLEYAQIGTLKKITFPTGGSQEFVYELHDFSHDDYTKTYNIESQVPGGTFSNPTYHEVEFTVAERGSVTFVELSEHQDGIDAYYSLSKKINGSYSGIPPLEMRPGYFRKIGEKEFFGNRRIIEPGDYKLSTSSKGNPYHIKLVLDQQGPVDFERIGGLRVREIKTYDPFSELTSHKLIEYSKEENGKMRSSGVVFTMPDYGAYYTVVLSYDAAADVLLANNPEQKEDITSVTYTQMERKIDERDDGSQTMTFTLGQVTEFFNMNSGPSLGNQCRSNTLTVYINLNSSPQIPTAYSSGSHVGYSEVKVYDVLSADLQNPPRKPIDMPDNVAYGGQIRKNGYSAYYFINEPSDQRYVYPYVPGEDLSYKNGKLLKSEVYEREGEDFVIKQRQTNQYEQISKVGNDIVYGLIAKRELFRACYLCTQSDIVDGFYSYISRWHYLKSTKTELFENNTLSREVTHNYDLQVPYSHFLNTGSQTTDSKGNLIETFIDRVVGAPELVRQQETFVNGSKTAGERILYTGSLPKQYDLWDRDRNDYQQEVAYRYDIENNIIGTTQHVTTVSPVENLLLWGYDNSHTLASFSNMSEVELTSVLDNANVDREWFGDPANENLYKAKLLQIQAALADHQQMQATLYDTPFGPSESIDTHGQSTYYFYDGFGRLIRIEDRDNHILQQYEYHYSNQ